MKNKTTLGIAFLFIVYFVVTLSAIGFIQYGLITEYIEWFETIVFSVDLFSVVYIVFLGMLNFLLLSMVLLLTLMIKLLLQPEEIEEVEKL